MFHKIGRFLKKHEYYFYQGILITGLLFAIILGVLSKFALAAYIIGILGLLMHINRLQEDKNRKKVPPLEAKITNNGDYGYHLILYNPTADLIILDMKKTGWMIGDTIKVPSNYEIIVMAEGSKQEPCIPPKKRTKISFSGKDSNNKPEKFAVESMGIFIVTTDKGDTIQAKVEANYLQQFNN